MNPDDAWDLIRAIEQFLGEPLFVLFRLFWLFSWLGFLVAWPPVGMALWFGTGLLAAWCARKKGRNPYFWGLFAGLFWGYGFVILALLGSRPVTNDTPAAEVLDSEKSLDEAKK